MFDKLYNTVRKCEQTEECPLYLCGVFFNTAMETIPCLDWERHGWHYAYGVEEVLA